MSLAALRERLSWPALGGLVLLGLLALLLSQAGARTALEAELASLLGRAASLQERLEAAEVGEELAFAGEDVWAAQGGQAPEQRLQAFAIDALDRAGQTLLRYEQVTVPHATSAPTVALQLEFQGPLRGLVAVLQGVEASRPRLAVERLAVRAMGEYDQVEGETVVASQVVVWGFSGGTLD